MTEDRQIVVGPNPCGFTTKTLFLMDIELGLTTMFAVMVIQENNA